MKHQCEIINGKKMWKRVCPQCREDIWHIKRDAVYRQSNLKRICRKCWIKNKTNILERNCPKCSKLIIYSHYKNFWSARKNNTNCRHCSKLGNIGRKGQKCSNEHKLKVGLSNKGKKISEESKHKMRLVAIKRIKENKIKPYTNFNPKACEYFNKLNEEKGWNLQHALNGGETEVCGYFLDAYDKEKNIVVEYDEPRHNRPSIKKKDLLRQNNIINHLQCKFYRFSESLNKLEKMI